MKNEYKYVHLLYGNDTKFSGRLVEMFNTPGIGINIEEHVFVTPYKNVYSELKVYENVILDSSNKNLYKRYASKSEFIISHGAESRGRVLFTSRKIMKKIVYRYWGGSKVTGYSFKEILPIRLYHYLERVLMRYTYSKYAAIGISNSVDILDLSRVLKKDTKYYRLPYSVSSYDLFQEVYHEMKQRSNENKKKTILIGHSGVKENNHISILDRLKKYDLSEFIIYIPLSYGDKEYIESVMGHVESLKMDNIIIIRDMMPFDEYLQFLSTIDFAIFDGTTSYALGNLSYLIGFNKTIFLNPLGIVAKALDIEKFPYKSIETIGKEAINELFKKIVFEKYLESDLGVPSKESRINEWKKLFEDLEGLK